MEYVLRYDLHTHTKYSHGKGSIYENAKVAHEKALTMIGISDHGPGHLLYGIKLSNIAQMRRDIQKAQNDFPELVIKLGVEANIINPSGNLDISKEDQKLFDYVIAGYHYGVLGEKPLRSIAMCIGGCLKFLSNETRNTDIIIKALYENKIKVLTHPDDKIKVDMDAIARACAATHTMLEINDHHLSLNSESLRIAAKYNVDFVISSDAHHPEDVGNCLNSMEIVQEAGIPIERIVNLWIS